MEEKAEGRTGEGADTGRASRAFGREHSQKVEGQSKNIDQIVARE